MRQLSAFINKEFTEAARNSKILILGILFVLFGIMNPAFAKLTPWIMENMSDSLEEAGLAVHEVSVDALTSWTQFHKNIPMALIVFLLMFSGIMTLEYQKGTLINMITKGLSRWKVIIAKTVVMVVLWTLGYWLCFGVTYVYNEYFWDNKIAVNLMFSAVCIYLLGVWTITLIMLASAIVSTSSAVAVSTGLVFMVMYVVSMIPHVKKFLPVKLLDASQLPAGVGEPKDYSAAIIITFILIIIDIIASIAAFNRKNV